MSLNNAQMTLYSVFHIKTIAPLLLRNHTGYSIIAVPSFKSRQLWIFKINTDPKTVMEYNVAWHTALC